MHLHLGEKEIYFANKIIGSAYVIFIALYFIAAQNAHSPGRVGPGI